MLTEFVVAPTLTWNEAFAGWLAEDGRKQGGKGRLSRKSVEAYLQDVTHFSRWYEQTYAQQFAFDDLRREVVRAYFDWQAGLKAAPKSRNRRLASLRALVRFGRELALLDGDPTDLIERIEEARRAPRSKCESEYQSLRSVSTDARHLKCQTEKHGLLGLRDRVIFGLFGQAGLRIAEVAGLDLDDLHLDAKFIHVTGKGGYEGYVEIPESLKSDIEAWLAARPGQGRALITDWTGERITTGQIRRRLEQIGATAEIKIKPHDLRHTYINRLLKHCIDDLGMLPPVAFKAVASQARHRDERTTMAYYFNPTDAQIRAAVEAM